MIEILFKKLGLEGAMLGLWLTKEITEKFKSEVIEPGQFQIGDKVILTEQDTSYSVGIVEVIYTDTYDIRLIESTHYPAGTFENHIYCAPLVRLKPYKGD